MSLCRPVLSFAHPVNTNAEIIFMIMVHFFPSCPIESFICAAHIITDNRLMDRFVNGPMLQDLGLRSSPSTTVPDILF